MIRCCCRLVVAVLSLLLPVFLAAQGLGPDIICSDIPTINDNGRVGNLFAFSLGTTACNVGHYGVPWVPTTNEHPVVIQNVYRRAAGRFEQIGMSWVRHGVTVFNESGCGSCPNPGTLSLEPACATTNPPSTNGSQMSVRPRSQINVTTGAFVYPAPNPPLVSSLVARRIQVSVADFAYNLEPVFSYYYVEARYVSAADAAAGNDDNNATWRRLSNFTASNSQSVNATLYDTPRIGEPAIMAWKTDDPGVDLSIVDVPDDGRFIVGCRTTQQGSGWHWEFAVQNCNSHRSMRSFSVPIPAGAIVSNVGFHDVPHHDGDGEIIGTDYDSTDWTSLVDSGGVTWSTPDYAAAPNGNALRWGSLYNFRFDTDSAPPSGPMAVTLGLYRPGIPAQISAAVNPTNRLKIVSGGAQGGNALEPFLQPLVVETLDEFGAPQAGVHVSFLSFAATPQVYFLTPEVITDANGRAQTLATANFFPGLKTIQVTSPHGLATCSWEVRDLRIFWFPGTGYLGFDYQGGRPNLPVVLAADLPQPPITVLPWGTIATSILTPQPTLMVRDGIGVFGPPDPTMVTDSEGRLVPPLQPGFQALAGIGIDLVFQVYALDGNDIVISAAKTVHF